MQLRYEQLQLQSQLQQLHQHLHLLNTEGAIGPSGRQERAAISQKGAVDVPGVHPDSKHHVAGLGANKTRTGGLCFVAALVSPAEPRASGAGRLT